MAKFHINPASGDPGECNATQGRCPYASEAEHYGSKEEARAAFEATMGGASVISHEKRTLNPNLFVSVLSSSQDVLSERFALELGQDLEPGEYAASYYDEKSGRDRYVRLTVSDSGAVEYDKLSKFTPIVSPSSPRTQQAIGQLRESLEELVKTKSDPFYCQDNKIDRVTLLENTQGIRRVLAKHDWNKAEEAVKGRLELEDLEWAIDHDLELAERENNVNELAALREGKQLVSAFLDTVNRNRG